MDPVWSAARTRVGEERRPDDDHHHEQVVREEARGQKREEPGLSAGLSGGWTWKVVLRQEPRSGNVRTLLAYARVPCDRSVAAGGGIGRVLHHDFLNLARLPSGVK